MPLELIVASHSIIALPPFDIQMGKLESLSRFLSFCPHERESWLQFLQTLDS